MLHTLVPRFAEPDPSLPLLLITLQISPLVLLEMAETQVGMPSLSMFIIGANALNKEEFREAAKDKPELLDLTVGLHPRLRFTPFV